MSKERHSVDCAKCGSIGTVRPPFGPVSWIEDYWIKQCWVCGFEYFELEGRAASWARNVTRAISTEVDLGGGVECLLALVAGMVARCWTSSRVLLPRTGRHSPTVRTSENALEVQVVGHVESLWIRPVESKDLTRTWISRGAGFRTGGVPGSHRHDRRPLGGPR